jgi:hypothetical protein
MSENLLMYSPREKEMYTISLPEEKTRENIRHSARNDKHHESLTASLHQQFDLQVIAPNFQPF